VKGVLRLKKIENTVLHINYNSKLKVVIHIIKSIFKKNSTFS